MHTDDQAKTTQTVPEISHVPRPLRVAQSVWVIATGLSLITVLCAVVVEPGVLEWIVLGTTVAQAGIALPAAVYVVRGRRWAHRALTVLALVCIAPSWQALQHHAWPSAVLNLMLVATLGLLQRPSVIAYCGRLTNSARS